MKIFIIYSFKHYLNLINNTSANSKNIDTKL